MAERLECVINGQEVSAVGLDVIDGAREDVLARVLQETAPRELR